MAQNPTLISIGDAEYTTDRNAVLRARNIGSCMALAAVDSKQGGVGLLHALLPDARIDPFSADAIEFNPYKYISTGVPLFLRHVFDMGASHQSLYLFAAGGADLINDPADLNLGYRNIVTLRRVLWHEGVLLHGEELAGTNTRTLTLSLEDESITIFNRKKGISTYGT